MQQVTRKRHEAVRCPAAGAAHEAAACARGMAQRAFPCSPQELKKIVKKREKEYKASRQAKVTELSRESKRAVKEEGSDKKVCWQGAAVARGRMGGAERQRTVSLGGSLMLVASPPFRKRRRSSRQTRLWLRRG